MSRVVPRVRARVARRSGALAALVLLVAVLAAPPAAAHNSLRATDPADGATVETAPAQVTLTFDQPALELGSQVVVTGPDGAVVSDGPVQLLDVSVVQPLVTTLPAGAYTVDWRVTSADGHPLTGSLTFTATAAVGVAEPAAPTEPAETAEPTDAPEAAPASDAPTDEAAPTDVATTTGVDGPLDEEGTSPWVWVVLAVATLAAGATVALLAARRRTGLGGTAAGGPPAAPSGDGPSTGA
ncbi:copper resistance CopC family protein [Cellulomonas xiejunii]|uniref:copper resistance CopC family protein n=1 Tax=Cellulomonas xiejunii TaxID=2968083 RepID=UPI001D0E5A36|nr:copper resistance CopC family protein [Cellulomonas xiejunii]MCC2314110.1 copper resistance protein CopC [Cellulomonas xiejunii]